MSTSEFSLLAMAWVLWATVFGLFGWAVGRHKGRGADGAWLGIILGILGVVVTAILTPAKPKPAKRQTSRHQPPPPAQAFYRPDPLEVWEAAENAKTCIRPLPGVMRHTHAENLTEEESRN